MAAPFFYLRADERVVLQGRAALSYALVLAIFPVVALTVLLLLALGARAAVPDVARAVSASLVWTAYAILLGLVALACWRRAATSEYAVTDQRIYARVGRLVTRLHFTTHDKVTDIRYRQGPIERLLGLASLTFATAGAEVQVSGIRDSLALKAASENARDAFVRSLLAEAPVAVAADTAGADTAAHPAAPASAPAAAPPPAPAWTGPRPDYLQQGDTPVWHARPVPISAIGALRSLLGIVPLLFFAGALDGPQRAMVIAAGLGIILAFMGLRLSQLRRTEYVATDRRVYARRGLVGTTVSQLTYDKITDITYSQDVLGRVLGYGSVTVQTAGSNQAPIVMHGLAEPLVAKETIERWRDANVGGR